MNENVKMLPDLQASLLCDDVRQENNGKFIFIGIFDGLAVVQMPAIFPRICVANRWCCGEGVFSQKTRIVAPDGITEVAAGHKINVNLKDAAQSATSVEFFMNLRFNEMGMHWIEIYLDDYLKLRYPLVIRQAQVQNFKGQQPIPPQPYQPS